LQLPSNCPRDRAPPALSLNGASWQAVSGGRPGKHGYFNPA